MADNVLPFEPKKPQEQDKPGFTVYVLNMWTVKGFWGTLGIYYCLEECKADGMVAFEARPEFIKYRIESTQLILKTD